MRKNIVLATALMLCVISLPASAKLYKWVDDKGQTHYGETIPPEYANRDRSELGKDGRVIKKTEVLTPEELRAREHEEAKQRNEDKAALEQKRRDQALLNTFSNTREIDLSKERNLQQVESRINSINVQIRMTEATLQGHRKEAEVKTKTGKPIPASLQEDIDETQQLLDKQQGDLAKYKAEKISVEQRYEADKERFKLLTGAK